MDDAQRSILASQIHTLQFPVAITGTDLTEGGGDADGGNEELREFLIAHNVPFYVDRDLPARVVFIRELYDIRAERDMQIELTMHAIRALYYRN